MLIVSMASETHLMVKLFTAISTFILLFGQWICGAFTPPLSECYVVDRESYLYDFTGMVGQQFRYAWKDTDFVLNFCQNAENRSDAGYIDFGRYSPDHIFRSGSGGVDFVQRYRYGDLVNCEFTYEKMGRNVKVNIACGSCAQNTSCINDNGCICNVTYDRMFCSAEVFVAMNCGVRGPRIFPGFSVGFNPRGLEVVYNGITQWGFYKPFLDYRYGTEQTSLSLYLTAIAALSRHVGKPYFQIYPAKGLSMQLSGTAANGDPPTTETPTVLEVSWECHITRTDPYEVNITIPVDGYDPVVFYLSKLCGSKQDTGSNGSKGWATFGVLSCIAIVLATTFCCAGVCYKTRVEQKHGLEALPGVGILASCLNRLSGNDYNPIDQERDMTLPHGSWDGASASSWVPPATADSKYGAV